MGTNQKMTLEAGVETVCGWLNEDGCILFLGAAFSARSDGDGTGIGVPSTNDLLKILNSDSETLSDALEEKFGQNASGGLGRFIVEQFGSAKPRNGHHVAARLPFRTVITTNCDELMEHAYQNIWKDAVKVVIDEDMQRLGSADVSVVKPHGCVREVLTDRRYEAFLVFTRSQYETFAQGRPHLARWLTAILATHHFLYLGYGLNDEHFLKFLSEAMAGNPFRRISGPNEKSKLPMSLAVLGDRPRPEFYRFQHMTNVHLVESAADTFIEKVYEQYSKQSKTAAINRANKIREAFQEAPPEFMWNCCLASLRGAFPLELIQWNLHGEQIAKAQEWFSRFYQVGLVEPVMRMGGQWYHLHRDLTTICHKRALCELDHALKQYRAFLRTYDELARARRLAAQRNV